MDRKGKTFRERVDETRKSVTMLTPEEARRLLDAGGVLLIDVGEQWQLRERGTIPGARNITRGELEIKADTEEARRDPALADRQQKIILACGGGGKATLSAGALQEMGFTDVSVIQGGCRGWQKAGYALEPYPAPISGMASSRSNR
ncbi:rhodanese-like domain-containing protein [Bradyrhizobium sp.]|uniref:rhodanese-like domain-containing protein n=1 Tax=Bradyrhizobium sp. TaxID=376 RepID=UPI003BB1162D